LNILLEWFGNLPADDRDDRRLGEWRADRDEAGAIARYVRWKAEQPRSPSRHVWRILGWQISRS
jgi:hypothetical protein